MIITDVGRAIAMLYLAKLQQFCHVRWMIVRGRGAAHRADDKNCFDYRGAGWFQVRCRCGKVFFQYDNRK